MDGRLKAALTSYLIREGVKPSRLGDIVSVEMNVFHAGNGDFEPCDVEPEIEIEYDRWTVDMTHSLRHVYTIAEDDLEDFLTFIANYRQES